MLDCTMCQPEYGQAQLYTTDSDSEGRKAEKGVMDFSVLEKLWRER
jgi:hypothetical protein